MRSSIQQIQSLALQHFKLLANATPLTGEIDLNFLLQTPSGQKFNLKITHPDTRQEYLEFQNALMQRLGDAGLGLEIPRALRSEAGA